MNTKRNPAVTPLGFRMAWGEETPSAYTVKTPKFARKLEWTSESPIAPGWYWVATNPLWGNKPEIVYIGRPEYEDRIFVYEASASGVLIEDYHKKYPRLWLGPLPMPELQND